MASRLLTFLYLFNPRAPTTAVVNSWATVCLWRRYFQLEDQKDDEKEKESIQESTYRAALGESASEYNVDGWIPTESDPVRSPWARRELMDFRRSISSPSSRNLSANDQSTLHPQHLNRNAPTTASNNERDPLDLRVNGMFLPQ